MHSLNSTSRRLGTLSASAFATLLLAACSSTPKLAEQPLIEPAAVTPPAAAIPVAEVPALDETRPLDEPLPEIEPKTAEEAVALAVAEENLLNRIRVGFAMEDADHVNVDREISWFARHPDYLDRTFRRAERYLFFIVEELEARNMPLELALLPLVESAFNPVAKSHARAVGLWQFIPSTGRRYGLEQNHSYDGRRDVVESTRAALDYLQFLADEFDGNWHHAVAAYNCGEANVARALKRNRAKGKPTDFFSLDLPRETRGYLPKLLAIRRVVLQPEKFGLEFGHIANQPYFAKVELTAPVDLGVAAQLVGIPKEDLIALNPAYYRAVTSPDGPGHLLVPIDRAEQLREGLAELSPEQRVPKIYYTVHRGDTVSTIARKLGVTQAELRAANRIKNNLLRVGQELVIDRGAVALRASTPAAPANSVRVVSRDPNFVAPPAPPITAQRTRQPDVHRVRKGESLWSIARMHGVSVEALAEENGLKTNAGLVAGKRLEIPRLSNSRAATLAANDARENTVQRVTYVVRTGDTLSRIAAAFRVDIRQLLNWNKLRSANSIKAGQKLIMFVENASRSGG